MHRNLASQIKQYLKNNFQSANEFIIISPVLQQWKMKWSEFGLIYSSYTDRIWEFLACLQKIKGGREELNGNEISMHITMSRKLTFKSLAQIKEPETGKIIFQFRLVN